MPLYCAITEDESLENINDVHYTWGNKCPHIKQSCLYNWNELATFFKYLEARKS